MKKAGWNGKKIAFSLLCSGKAKGLFCFCIIASGEHERRGDKFISLLKRRERGEKPSAGFHKTDLTLCYDKKKNAGLSVRLRREGASLSQFGKLKTYFLLRVRRTFLACRKGNILVLDEKRGTSRFPVSGKILGRKGEGRAKSFLEHDTQPSLVGGVALLFPIWRKKELKENFNKERSTKGARTTCSRGR